MNITEHVEQHLEHHRKVFPIAFKIEEMLWEMFGIVPNVAGLPSFVYFQYLCVSLAYLCVCALPYVALLCLCVYVLCSDWFKLVVELFVWLICAVVYGVFIFIRNRFPGTFAKSIEGEIILLTGGGSGIGRIMARKLAALGATVVTLDVNEKGNDDTVNMIRKDGNNAHGFACNLSSKDEIYSVSKAVKEQVGAVSILINNAGVVSGTSLLDTSDENIERSFNVNVLAHFWTIKTFLPDMIRAKKGHIVTVASLAGYSGSNKLVDYCSSKFANIGMDEALKVELMVQELDSFIKTTVICPYYTSTGMFAGVSSKVIPILEPEFVAEEAVKAILMNKPVLILPGWCSALIVLKSLVKTEPFNKLGQIFGFNCSMDQFKGRPSNDK